MCNMRGRHRGSHGCHCGSQMGHFPQLKTAEEEAKDLENYKEALENQLERVNKKLKELKP